MKSTRFWFSLFARVVIGAMSVQGVYAQVPPDIETALRKIGQVVDPACTSKLYRPLMPKNDYNTYWPIGGSAPNKLTEPLYPGIALARDVQFGANPKDLFDIFSPEKGNGNRTVLLYLPGGGGNKIEQQSREANAFYDNIGRWGVNNGLIVVTMQRHAGPNWDDGGRDISTAIQWLQTNVAKYKGNPDRMFVWAQSAANGPLGVYIGHPELYGPKGVGVKGAIFMSGNPVAGLGNTAAAPSLPPQPAPGSACGLPSGTGTAGAITGPSSAAPPAGAPAAAAAPAAGARGGQQIDAATQAARSNLPGFKSTKVEVMLARAELDPGVTGDMAPSDIALHDEMCSAGHCPTMLFMKGESHMSAVFSIDTPDKTVSGPVLAWINKVK